MDKSHGAFIEKFAGFPPKKFAGFGMNAPALVIDTGEYTEIVRDRLREHYGPAKSAIKLIARAANCNERTAENWFTGKNAPGGLHLLRLAAQVPGLQAEVRRLMAMDADLDPDFMRDFCAFRDLVSRAARKGVTA